MDVDLSPMPASSSSEGSTRGYMGRSRSKTGRKLVRVRASQYQEIVWEDLLLGRVVENLTMLQDVIQQVERLLGLGGDGPEIEVKRTRTEFRLDAGWGGEEAINWLLRRGYQVTGKFKSTSRVQKLVKPISEWQTTSSAGREVAVVPQPVVLSKPSHQYAVRTPSKDRAGGYYYSVLFTTRLELAMQEVVDHYDDRAGMESDIKSDKRGLGLATLRKHKLAAQKIVILLVELAHNILVWSRIWLAKSAPRLESFGMVRLIQEVWAVPGRVKVVGDRLKRVRLHPDHPRAGDISPGLAMLLLEGQSLGFLG